MKVISSILIFIVFLSCNSNIITTVTNDLKFDSITSRINLKEFRYHNLNTFDSIDYWDSKDLKRLTDTILLSKWFDLDKDYLYNYYDIYLLSDWEPIGSILPLIFTQTGSDYGAIVLKLIDTNNGKLINTFELNGGSCGGPGQLDNGKWMLCSSNKSKFINDSTISNANIKFYCDSLDEESEMIVDTIKYLYKIDRIKGLLGIQIDSIRIKTKLKNYVR